MTKELDDLYTDIERRRGCDPCGLATQSVKLARMYQNLLEDIYDNQAVCATVCGRLPNVYKALRQIFDEKDHAEQDHAEQDTQH